MLALHKKRLRVAMTRFIVALAKRVLYATFVIWSHECRQKTKVRTLEFTEVQSKKQILRIKFVRNHMMAWCQIARKNRKKQMLRKIGVWLLSSTDGKVLKRYVWAWQQYITECRSAKMFKKVGFITLLWAVDKRIKRFLLAWHHYVVGKLKIMRKASRKILRFFLVFWHKRARVRDNLRVARQWAEKHLQSSAKCYDHIFRAWAQKAFRKRHLTRAYRRITLKYSFRSFQRMFGAWKLQADSNKRTGVRLLRCLNKSKRCEMWLHLRSWREFTYKARHRKQLLTREEEDENFQRAIESGQCIDQVGTMHLPCASIPLHLSRVACDKLTTANAFHVWRLRKRLVNVIENGLNIMRNEIMKTWLTVWRIEVHWGWKLFVNIDMLLHFHRSRTCKVWAFSLWHLNSKKRLEEQEMMVDVVNKTKELVRIQLDETYVRLFKYAFLKREIMAAWNKWAQLHHEQRRIQTLVLRSLTRWQKSVYAMAIATWTTHAADKRRVHAVGTKVANRLLHKATLLAYDRWMDQACELKRMRQISERAGARMKSRSVMRAWGRWVRG